MKQIIILILILNTLLWSADDDRKSRIDKQIEIEMEKEKRHAKEQIFYNQDNYDFKGAEVNKDSLDSVPHIEVDDFNIDSVYD